MYCLKKQRHLTCIMYRFIVQNTVIEVFFSLLFYHLSILSFNYALRLSFFLFFFFSERPINCIIPYAKTSSLFILKYSVQHFLSCKILFVKVLNHTLSRQHESKLLHNKLAKRYLFFNLRFRFELVLKIPCLIILDN